MLLSRYTDTCNLLGINASLLGGKRMSHCFMLLKRELYLIRVKVMALSFKVICNGMDGNKNHRNMQN